MYKDRQLVSGTILEDINSQFMSLGLFADETLTVHQDCFNGNPGFMVNGYGEIDSDICFTIFLVRGKIHIHGLGLKLECNPGDDMRPEITRQLNGAGYFQTWVKIV